MPNEVCLPSLLTSCAVACVCAAAPAAAQFPSENVALHSRLDLSDLGATFAEDCWGYVSTSGREYAIIGLSQGTAFVEITNPASPVIVDTKFQAFQGRDMKVYQDFVYSTVESGPTYVYDVSAIDSGVVSLAGTYCDGAHNLAVDEVSGFLYHAVGGPLNIYDLTDPSNPTFVGSWPGETHDVQVVTYTSGTYSGRQIAFVSAGYTGQLEIVDVTDKSNVFLVGQTSYPSSAYTHQGWLSGDRRYFYINDELDGLARTTILDVGDLASPTFVTDFTNGVSATDHNLYLSDDYVFAANYASGLRIFDASDPVNLSAVGYFDTYPSNNDPGFVGAWNAYPFFPSGTVIVSDRSGGLFVLDPTQATTPATVVSRNAGANPASYTASAPVLGSTWNASVDLSVTGHSFAQVFGYDSPASRVLARGQVLLVGGNKLFLLPLMAAPAAWSVSIPADMALVGLNLYTQAAHVFGVKPFALSNAQDLFVGY